MCTTNESAHMKKVWKLIVCTLCLPLWSITAKTIIVEEQSVYLSIHPSIHHSLFMHLFLSIYVSPFYLSTIIFISVDVKGLVYVPHSSYALRDKYLFCSSLNLFSFICLDHLVTQIFTSQMIVPFSQ